MRGFEEEEGIWKRNLKQSNNKKQQQIQFKEKHEVDMTSFCEPQKKKSPKKAANALSIPSHCLQWECRELKGILHPSCLHTSSHFRCFDVQLRRWSISRCISMGCFPCAAVGMLSAIGQHWDTARALLHFHGAECFLGAPAKTYLRRLAVILHRGLTPLINSAHRSTERRRPFDWLPHWG